MDKLRLFLTALIVFLFSSTQLWASGDPEAGKSKSAACSACHGDNGNSLSSGFPKLAGQNVRYFVKQLQDIKSGAREVPEMAGIVASLTEQDMTDLAAYFEAQTTSLGGVKKELLDLGQSLYRGGNPVSGVPACAACHGPAGAGVPSAGFPSLSGQHETYLSAQLEAFRAAGRGDFESKQRNNDGESRVMQSVAKNLSDDEIRAVSNYISGLY